MPFISQSIIISSIFVMYLDQISDKEWLKYNIDPLDEVLQKWDNTFCLRKSYIKGNHTLSEIFEEWPLLKQSFGHRLVRLILIKNE